MYAKDGYGRLRRGAGRDLTCFDLGSHVLLSIDYIKIDEEVP
jgi:hypothetical protein